MLAAVENTQDVFVCASCPFTQRSGKLARYVNCSLVAGRFTPGAFTNQIQAAFREPRLLVISDPRSDHQKKIIESSNKENNSGQTTSP